MTKPTERIVVFVTPAQKVAIAASAEHLGISVSELVRRALAGFDATGEQVKVAGLVDRLRRRQSVTDPINAALHAPAPAPAVPRTSATSDDVGSATGGDGSGAADDGGTGAPLDAAASTPPAEMGARMPAAEMDARACESAPDDAAAAQRIPNGRVKPLV